MQMISSNSNAGTSRSQFIVATCSVVVKQIKIKAVTINPCKIQSVMTEIATTTKTLEPPSQQNKKWMEKDKVMVLIK